MYFEYAIDPAALNNWERVRYFLDALGPWKGRLIAKYPKNWLRRVYESLNCPDVEKSRVEVRLRALDKRVFSSRSNAVFNGDRTWIDNALEEHGKRPFRAVVASSPSAQGFVLDASEVDESHPLWHVEQGQVLSRDPAVFADAVSLLLSVSSRVVFVDPYFKSSDHEKRQAVIALLQATPILTIEIVASNAALDHTEAHRSAASVLPRWLPAGRSVVLSCRQQKGNGPRLHNRYLLTDVGGVQFGDSIEAGALGETDRVSILGDGEHKRLWQEYTGSPLCHDEFGSPLKVTGAS